MSRLANKAKTHFLKNDDLSSILEPAAPGETAFTATKGEAERGRSSPRIYAEIHQG